MNNRPDYSYTNASVPEYTFNPSQGYTGHADLPLDVQIYGNGTRQGTQKSGYYPPPPQPAFPQYNSVYSSQQPANPQPTSQKNSIQQRSNTNAHHVPGQPVSYGNTSGRPMPSASQQQSTSGTKTTRRNMATIDSSVTAQQRNNRTEQTTEEGTEMEVADGNLTLELPVAGSTIEKPPDGRFVAWRIVAACATLKACSSMCLLLLFFVKADLTNDIGDDATDGIISACQKLQHLAAPLAAIAIVLLDYRKVAIIGSIMVSLGFFISGWLKAELSGLIGVLVGGIAGLGLAFWYLCAIIPILEYFERRRLFAIMVSNVGSIVGAIIVLIVYVELLKNNKQLTWEDPFKYMLIPGALGLSASFYLRPLELKMKHTPGRTFVQTILGVLDYQLFKDFMLYLVMLLFFFDQFGRAIPTSYMVAMMADKSFSLTQQLVQIFLVPVASLMGLIALIFWKSKGLIVTLLLWGPMDLLVGFFTLQIPAYDKFGWVAFYSVIFGFTQTVVSSLIDHAVPDTFGFQNIRIVEGLLGFSAGLGELVASYAADDANNRNDDDDYSAAFYLAASILLAAGVIALVARFLFIRKMKKIASISNESGNDGKEADDDAQDSNDIGEKTHRGLTNTQNHSKGDNSKGHNTDNVMEDVNISDTEYI